MTDEELVKRLRGIDRTDIYLYETMNDAADRIEKLEAKLAKAVEAADGMLDEFCIHETQQQSLAYDNMCAALAEIKGGDTT